MKLRIFPGRLKGTVTAPPSKSFLHRYLICAALCSADTEIRCSNFGEDILATLRCLSLLCADVARHDGRLLIHPNAADAHSGDCGESASTLRFLLPVLGALGKPCDLSLRGRLPSRPLEPLWSELSGNGVCLSLSDGGVLSVSGRLTGREFSLPGSVSSQFLSGILFALPLLDGGKLHVTGTVVSENYLKMTISVLNEFGISVISDGNTFTVSGKYRSPGAVSVEGDWSNAAYWLAAQRKKHSVNCVGLEEDSLQGDRVINAMLEQIDSGCAVIDAANIPDLVPLLAVYAAGTPGKAVFLNAARLRQKESDRIAATVDMICALGGSAVATTDGLCVYGKEVLRGGTVSGCHDHRIVMSAAIAATGCETPVMLEDAEAVEKSYPDFWDDFSRLGGKTEGVFAL